MTEQAKLTPEEEREQMKWFSLLADPETAKREHLASMHYDPRGVSVRFFRKGMLNPERSMLERKAVFENREFIEIRVPGDKDEIRVREVRWYDKEHHPVEYAAFAAGRESQVIGTPLEMAPFIDPARLAELKFHGIHTIEQLRDLSDSNVGKFMGAVELRRKAANYLAVDAGTSFEDMQSQLKAAQERIAALEGAKRPKG